MKKRKPWRRAMPPNEDIWLVFPNYTLPQSEHYCHWFDTQAQAIEEKKHHEKLQYKGDLSAPAHYKQGKGPHGFSIWLLFDLSNVHPGSRGCVWWFDTREEARRHRKRQGSNKHNADLSAPVQYTLLKEAK